MLSFCFCPRRVNPKIPHVTADAFVGHFDEGILARLETLVNGVAEDSAGWSPGLNLDVGGIVFFFAREVDADAVNQSVATLDFALEGGESVARAYRPGA